MLQATRHPFTPVTATHQVQRVRALLHHLLHQGVYAYAQLIKQDPAVLVHWNLLQLPEYPLAHPYDLL